MQNSVELNSVYYDILSLGEMIDRCSMESLALRTWRNRKYEIIGWNTITCEVWLHVDHWIMMRVEWTQILINPHTFTLMFPSSNQVTHPVSGMLGETPNYVHKVSIHKECTIQRCFLNNYCGVEVCWWRLAIPYWTLAVVQLTCPDLDIRLAGGLSIFCDNVGCHVE